MVPATANVFAVSQPAGRYAATDSTTFVNKVYIQIAGGQGSGCSQAAYAGAKYKYGCDHVKGSKQSSRPYRESGNSTNHEKARELGSDNGDPNNIIREEPGEVA